MRLIIAIFWNRLEVRLRAGWRLLIQLIVFVMLLIGLSGLELLPLSRTSQKTLIAVVYLAQGIALGWLVGRLLDRRRFAAFGFNLNRQWWLDFSFGLLLGAALMSGIFLIEYHAGWVAIEPSSASTGDVLVVSILGFLAVGVNEEFTFRGYQIRNLAEGVTCRWIGPRWAVLLALVLSSAFFGLAHAGNPNATAVSTLNIVMGGLALSLPYALTGELAIPIGLHITWNLFQGTIYGFPVSGSTSRGLISVVQNGPELWTGGPFGPEAGLLAVFSLLAACGLIVVWVTSSSRRPALDAAIALYDRGSFTGPSS